MLKQVQHDGLGDPARASQVMGVGDGDGQGVGGVGAGDGDSGEQALDHKVDLDLVGIARPDDRFLNEPRGILADIDARARGDHQAHATGLGELERRLGVLVDEDFFGGGGVRCAVGEEGFKLGREVGQALGEQFLGIGLEMAVGEMGQAIALGADQAPAGGAEAGVEAEDDQPSFSITSSGMS